jgi:membrane protease subunit HflK
VREVVGRSNVDAVLYEKRESLASDIAKSTQAQLERLNAGILIDNVNVQHVQVPEQVQAAFDDAFRASADRDRFKNEGQAYAANEIPKAQGTAARLLQEAEAHRATVVAQAEGDAQRFRSVLSEYQKAPAVTRDRMYLETMQSVYSNVSKVMVESRNGSNLLYLPLDRLLQQSGVPAAVPAAATSQPTEPTAATDARAREGSRSRDRDSR